MLSSDGSPPPRDEKPTGVKLLVSLLANVKTLTNRSHDTNLRFDLIGHSMGAFVVNDILAHGAAGSTMPEFDRVVYLASADSVDSYQRSALPYLLKHPDTHIYHSVLNPRDELAAAFAPLELIELLPRGTLLVWIDRYLEKQSKFRSRTSGRYVNLVPTLLETPVTLRKRIHFKSFPETVPGKTCPSGLKPDFPRRHGEFSAYLFKDPEFWLPKAPGDRKRCLE